MTKTKSSTAVSESKKRVSKPKAAKKVEVTTVACIDAQDNSESEDSFLKKFQSIDRQISLLVSLHKEHKVKYDNISRDLAVANGVFNAFGMGDVGGGSKEIIDSHQSNLRKNMLDIQRKVQDLQVQRMLLLSGG